MLAGQSPSSNRRLFYRQPMYLRIDLRVAGIRVAVPSTLVDISGGGCQIHSRTMLRPRKRVEFDLPRAEQTDLHLSGTIRKVVYTPVDRMFRYTIEFDGIEERERDLLLRFVIDEQRRGLRTARAAASDIPPANARHMPMTRIQELRSSHRVELNCPVNYTVGDSPTVFTATAIDISAGGLRLIAEQVLRQEWSVTIWFTLSNDALRALHQLRGSDARAMRPFSELKLVARPLGGVKQSRGRFVQSLVFVNPEKSSTDEIMRFVQATRLTTMQH